MTFECFPLFPHSFPGFSTLFPGFHHVFPGFPHVPPGFPLVFATQIIWPNKHLPGKEAFMRYVRGPLREELMLQGATYVPFGRRGSGGGERPDGGTIPEPN